MHINCPEKKYSFVHFPLNTLTSSMTFLFWGGLFFLEMTLGMLKYCIDIIDSINIYYYNLLLLIITEFYLAAKMQVTCNTHGFQFDSVCVADVRGGVSITQSPHLFLVSAEAVLIAHRCFGCCWVTDMHQGQGHSAGKGCCHDGGSRGQMVLVDVQSCMWLVGSRLDMPVLEYTKLHP